VKIFENYTVTVIETARELEVSTSFVYRLIADGLLGCYRIGGAGSRGVIRVSLADVELYRSSRHVDPIAESLPRQPQVCSRPKTLNELSRYTAERLARAKSRELAREPAGRPRSNERTQD
jgi:excisionase family DNA binding protein